jgi:hypothetical protein
MKLQKEISITAGAGAVSQSSPQKGKNEEIACLKESERSD